MDKLYIAADGDDMGSKIGAYIMSNNVEKAKELSRLIHKGEKKVIDFATKTWQGNMILSGGDDMLVAVSPSKFDSAQLEQMRKLYHQTTGATLTVGVGDSAAEAAKALAYGKNTGKNKVVVWDKKLQPKYDKMLKARVNDLRTKLRSQGGTTEAKREAIELAKSIRYGRMGFYSSF